MTELEDWTVPNNTGPEPPETLGSWRGGVLFLIIFCVLLALGVFDDLLDVITRWWLGR